MSGPTGSEALAGEQLLIATKVDAVQTDGCLILRASTGEPVYLSRDLLVTCLAVSNTEIQSHLAAVASDPSKAYTGPTLVKDET